MRTEERYNALKYVGYSVVCAEVPNEISLAFNISGCTHHCDGCHSPFLWENNGVLLLDNLGSIINTYKDFISCVCFMGGDQNIKELFEACKVSKMQYNIKTCIYSGSDDTKLFSEIIEKGYLDYLKIGPYIPLNGGLDNPNTNQVMYKIIKNNSDYILDDITYLFRVKF